MNGGANGVSSCPRAKPRVSWGLVVDLLLAWSSMFYARPPPGQYLGKALFKWPRLRCSDAWAVPCSSNVGIDDGWDSGLLPSPRVGGCKWEGDRGGGGNKLQSQEDCKYIVSKKDVSGSSGWHSETVKCDWLLLLFRRSRLFLRLCLFINCSPS